MANEPNTPGADPHDSRLAAIRAKEAARRDQSNPSHSPSKPLQIFLLVALVITGAAYVVDEWTKITTDEVMSKHSNKLKRLVANQSRFITETDLGRQAEAKKQYKEAIVHYRRALLGEVNAEGYVNLGNALLKQGNPDMAFSQFKEALHLNPDVETVYLAWGQALAFQGKTEDALRLYQDALRHDPKFAQVHYNLAVVLEQMEQTAQAANNAAKVQLLRSEAAKQYAAAEELGLNTPEFWSGYGTLLNKLGKFPEAESRLAKAVLQQPGLGAAQYQLAIAQDRQGEYPDAIGHYEATLAATPDDPATLNNLALLYATATNKEVRSSKMAIMLATRACDATTNQNAHFMETLAIAYAADGDFFQAMTWENKAIHRATQLDDHVLLRELQSQHSQLLPHKGE